MTKYIDIESIEEPFYCETISINEELFVRLSDVVDFINRIPEAEILEIVSCNDCVLHGNCMTEDTFKIVRIENPYCCAGKKKEGYDNGLL